MATDPATIDRIVQGLLAYEPETIILFGSAARGDADEYSDIDLIVVKHSDKRFVQRLIEVTAFLPRDVAIDALVYTPEELRRMAEEGNPFIEQALMEGKVLYGDFPLSHRPSKSSWEGKRFMKDPRETAGRWLAQAEYSLRTAAVLLESGFWSQACFQAEQTAQLALKAFLFSVGRRLVAIHSIRELALECAREDPDFSKFEAYGMVLDRYYLSTRYPDALPAPAIPYQSFTEQEAAQALEYASEIVETVRAKVDATP